MRVCMFILAAWLFAGRAGAQEVPSLVERSNMSGVEMESDTLGVALKVPVTTGMEPAPFSMYSLTPYDYGYATWELHEGFNASVGLNVTFSPGCGTPSGVGFGQDVAFMYAVPLTNRLSVAGGIYASNFNWGSVSYRNVGFAGVVSFKVNEYVSLYAYGNKSFMPERSQSYYPLPNFSPDRLGGMVNFKLGTSGALSIGVEGVRCPNGYCW